MIRNDEKSIIPRLKTKCAFGSEGDVGNGVMNGNGGPEAVFMILWTVD